MKNTSLPNGVKSEQELAQEFIKKYKELCIATGFQIVVNPVWTSTNHGSFELVLQSNVGRLPKQSTN